MAEKYVRLDDVNKLMQHLWFSNGFIDEEFSKFLPTYDAPETNVGSMNAVEVLEWLKDSAHMYDVFDCDYEYLFDTYTTQEIVSRIEKYEADHIADADKKVEQNFEVGDIVAFSEDPYKQCNKYIIAEINDEKEKSILLKIPDAGLFGWVNAKGLEHTEPIMEEKKANETSDIYRFAEWCYVNGINFGFMSTAENPTPKRLREIVGRYESEIGKPKEEKQEIKKLSYVPDMSEIIGKIEELVDAVNELRGV